MFSACLKGLEPPTYWFVASHSIQLSYRHICSTTIIIAHPMLFVKSFFSKKQKSVRQRDLHSFLPVGLACRKKKDCYKNIAACCRDLVKIMKLFPFPCIRRTDVL